MRYVKDHIHSNYVHVRQVIIISYYCITDLETESKNADKENSRLLKSTFASKTGFFDIDSFQLNRRACYINDQPILRNTVYNEG